MGKLPDQITDGSGLSMDLSLTITTPGYYRLGLTETIHAQISTNPTIGKNSTTFIPLAARFKLPLQKINPVGPVKVELPSIGNAALAWDVKIVQDTSEEGTLWIDYQRNGETISLLAIPISVHTISFLGLPFDLAAFWGGAVSFTSLVLWLIIFILGFRRQKTTKTAS